MEPQDILLNRSGRLRSGWRFATFCVLFLIFISLAGEFLKVLWAVAPGTVELFEGNWGFVAQAVVFMIIPATLVGWVCCKFLEDLPPRSLGWALHRGWFRDLLAGSLVGALSLAAGVALAAAGGGMKFTLNAPVMFGTVGRTLLTSLPVFVLAAAGEEAIFRGYPLQTMARARLAWVAIILTSVVFSWGHLENPNAVRGFTFVNTALAGAWLAFAYLKTRSLWFPLGIHWAWNWTMGAVLGVPVSGIAKLTPEPLLRATDLGPAWLTGGAYGIEGGAACTVAILASILFIWRTRLVSPTEEMLRLTYRENPVSSER